MTRLVVDASVMADALWGTESSHRAAERAMANADLVAPHLIDLEVASVARRWSQAGMLDPDLALSGLRRLGRYPRLDRVAHVPLLSRVWSLRANVTAYDASYLALAEAMSAPLLTRDARLVRAALDICEVVLIEP